MTKDERATQHAESLKWISQMTVVDNSTDKIDQVGTLKELARQVNHEMAGFAATEKACDAFERLLYLSETRDSGQIRRVAQFLAAAWGTKNFELHALRSLDAEIGNDMLAVMDGIRYGRVAVCDMAEDASERVPAVLKIWELT